MKQSLVFIFLLLMFVGCDDKKQEDKIYQESKSKQDVESNTNNKFDKTLTLQEQLDNFLKYNGKECPSPTTNLSIKNVTYDIDSSSHTTRTQKHTNVYSNGDGSYTTTSYTTGGNEETTYHGFTLNARIENYSDKPIEVWFEFHAQTQYWSTGLFGSGFLGGAYAGNDVNIREHLVIPANGLKFSKYYKLNGWISGSIQYKLSSFGTEDDKRYTNAKTIEDYHLYLQRDGCHYHLRDAQKKIKKLFAKKTYEEALKIKNNAKRVVAIEKYLEVFPDDKKATFRLKLDKRMITLLKETDNYQRIVWEKNNPLLYSFSSPMKIRQYNNLLIYIDDYMQAAEKQYRNKIALHKKPLPRKPNINDFGNKLNNVVYPDKPIVIKGEFEKKKDFLVRKEQTFQEWQSKKDLLDAKYKSDMVQYKEEQKKLYDKAYNEWEKNKAKVEDENKALAEKYKNNIAKLDGMRKQWLWQAALFAIGNKDFTFEKLQYNSEDERFEYIVNGGALNLRFQGTIAIPIEKAKEFKEYVMQNLSIIFKIQNNKLFITDFIYQGKPSGYKATSNTKLVLLDKKQLKIERKKVRDAMARKEKIQREKERQRERDLKTIKIGNLRFEKLYGIGSSGKYLNWMDAKNYCENLTIAGWSDWHLPSKYELKKIYKKFGCSSNNTNHYWSSSSISKNKAISVEFRSCIWSYAIDVMNKKRKNSIVCVRKNK